MLTQEGIDALRERLRVVKTEAAQYFQAANPADAADRQAGPGTVAAVDVEREAVRMRNAVKRLGVEIAGAARGSALIADVDLLDLRRDLPDAREHSL